jgi:hypothetical protein
MKRMLRKYVAEFSQFSGAVVASVVLKLLFPHSEKLGATMPSGSDMRAFDEPGAVNGAVTITCSPGYFRWDK